MLPRDEEALLTQRQVASMPDILWKSQKNWAYGTRLRPSVSALVSSSSHSTSTQKLVWCIKTALFFFFLQNESTWVMNSSATKAVIFSHTNKTLPVKLLEDPFQTIKLLPTSWTCHSFCFQCGSMELPRYSICPECPSPAFPTWHTKTCPPVASFKATTSVRLCFPPSFYFPLLFFPFMPYFTYSNSP